MRKMKPSRNRRKSIRLRASIKARRKRRHKLSHHGKRCP